MKNMHQYASLPVDLTLNDTQQLTEKRICLKITRSCHQHIKIPHFLTGIRNSLFLISRRLIWHVIEFSGNLPDPLPQFLRRTFIPGIVQHPRDCRCGNSRFLCNFLNRQNLTPFYFLLFPYVKRMIKQGEVFVNSYSKF